MAARIRQPTQVSNCAGTGLLLVGRCHISLWQWPMSALSHEVSARVPKQWVTRESCILVRGCIRGHLTSDERKVQNAKRCCPIGMGHIQRVKCRLVVLCKMRLGSQFPRLSEHGFCSERKSISGQDNRAGARHSLAIPVIEPRSWRMAFI